MDKTTCLLTSCDTQTRVPTNRARVQHKDRVCDWMDGFLPQLRSACLAERSHHRENIPLTSAAQITCSGD